jgi:hypothetical protein
LFEVANPREKSGIGVDELPTYIRENEYLTGNEIAQLARLYPKPEGEFINDLSLDEIQLRSIEAKKLISEGKVLEAYQSFLR